MGCGWQCKSVKSSGNAMKGQKNGMWSFWRHWGLENQELPPGWIVGLCWRQFFPSPDFYIHTGASMCPAMTPRWSCSFVLSPISWVDCGALCQALSLVLLFSSWSSCMSPGPDSLTLPGLGQLMDPVISIQLCVPCPGAGSIESTACAGTPLAPDLHQEAA